MKEKIIISLLKIVAFLPLWILYPISDIVCFMIHRVARYRLKVVHRNLTNCFPELSEKEIQKIENKFYHNFCDSFVETIKLLHISDNEIKRRMEFENTELLDRLLAEGRSIVVYFSHCFNWVWAPSISLHTAIPPSDKLIFAQVYLPLNDEAFDNIMQHIRSRFGSRCLPKAKVMRYLLKYRNDGAQSITGFMSDQRPGHGTTRYATTFMGHASEMINGTETIARRMDMAVVYWDMERLGRGHYRITTHLISENPSETPVDQITDRYTRMVETTIRRDPANWLWSHNRWKNKVILPTPEQ